MTRTVKKAQVRHMCGQVKPSKLWNLVNNAVEAGQDERPADGKLYRQDWHKYARSDPVMTAEIICQMCKYLDSVEQKGSNPRKGRCGATQRSSAETGRMGRVGRAIDASSGMQARRARRRGPRREPVSQARRAEVEVAQIARTVRRQKAKRNSRRRRPDAGMIMRARSAPMEINVSLNTRTLLSTR